MASKLKSLAFICPRFLRSFAKNWLYLMRDVIQKPWEDILLVIDKNRIPTPPAKFRALVHGQPIDAKGHALIGRELVTVLQDHCGLKSTSIVLDIGCGCGRVATPITKFLTKGTYHGVDVVKEMVDWCNENISLRAPNFHFHHADFSNTQYRKDGKSADSYVFPFRHEMFDVIFAISVFTHLVPASANQYLREIARLLKPGSGRALLTFLLTNDHVRGLGAKSMFKFHQCDGYSVIDKANPEAVVAYEQADAITMLQNASLTVEALSLGQWSKNPGWTLQDAFLVSRSSVSALPYADRRDAR